jgi:hypothetical protein
VSGTADEATRGDPERENTRNGRDPDVEGAASSRGIVHAVERYVSSVFDKLAIQSSASESRRVLAVLLFLRS